MTESDELFGSNVNKGVWWICAYMGPGDSNCQGWQMPLHALPTQIVFTRVILVIIFLSTIFSFFMLVCFQTEECPRHIRIVVGVINILQGGLLVSAIGSFASIIRTQWQFEENEDFFEYKNPQVQSKAERVDFFTDTARYVYGDAIYGGFAASLTYLIVGALLLWKRDSIREFRKYTATNYSFTAGKPLLNGTQKLNASFFNNSSKNVPGVTQVQDVRKTKNGKTESRLVWQTVSDPTVKSGSPIGVTWSDSTNKASPNGVTDASMDVNKTEPINQQDYFI